MKIDCISDLHGEYPKLEGGDLLIVAGDLTGSDKEEQYIEFCRYVRHAGYKKVIVIAGNHDNLMQKSPEFFLSNDEVSYLCDSGTEFEYEEDVEEEHKFKGLISYKVKKKLKIWGSPWTHSFYGMNPHCKAFTVDTEAELEEKWKLIPQDTNILITHSPPYRVLDKIRPRILPRINEMLHVGSTTLGKYLNWDHHLQLHVFGHIHSGYGEEKGTNGILSYHYVNASIMNEDYDPVNDPIRVIL